jgi:hypothetical protein
MTRDVALRKRFASAVKILPRLPSGLAMVATTLLSIPLVPLINLRGHIKEARRLGLGRGRVLSRKMTGNAFAPATLHVVSLRDGPWDVVLAAVTEQAGAVGYAPETPRDWTRSKRNPRYIKRAKMLSILEVSVFLPGETIAGSRAVVPEDQTGLRFELRANR